MFGVCVCARTRACVHGNPWCMLHAAELTCGGMQYAILAETGAPAPEGSTREQLLRTLHTARDPRSKGRQAGRDLQASGARPQNAPTASPCSSAWDKFEAYYRMQLPLPPQELDVLFETMRTPLPVTFRLPLPCADRCASWGGCMVSRAHFARSMMSRFFVAERVGMCGA